MKKELGIAAALLTTSLNATDISIHDVRNTFSSNSNYSKSLKINKNTILSIQDREELEIMAEEIITFHNQEVIHSIKIISDMFDTWIITHPDETILTIEELLNDSKRDALAFSKYAKFHKQFKKLSSLEFKIAQIMQEHYNFALTFKPMIEEAKEAQAFMNNFIPQNEEVLRALA